jgi:hypothetical protein
VVASGFTTATGPSSFTVDLDRAITVNGNRWRRGRQ